MDVRNCYLFLLLLTSSTGTKSSSSNDSSIEDHRAPRVTGRIVKVYSGPRPEPYLCNSEGFKADPQSCASFYRCVQEKNGKFNVFRYQCAPGTVYDADLETCNHPRSTRRTECGGVKRASDSVGNANEVHSSQNELPRPINTNRLAFTKETNSVQTTGIPWVTSHRITSMSNSLLEAPQYSPSSGTYHTDIRNKENNYMSITSTNMPRPTKDEYQQSKTTSQPKVTSKNDKICSNNGFTGDTENCRKFYRCVGSQRGGFLQYEFFCSEPTVWDEEIQSCNHPWAVKRSKCGRSMALVVNSRVTDPPRTLNGMQNNNEQKATSELSNTAKVYGEKIIKTTQQQLQVSHGSKVSQTQTQISHSDQVIQNQTQISHGSAVSQTQTQIDYGHNGMQTQLQIDHSKDSSQSQTQIHESHATTEKNTNKNDHCLQSGFMGDSNDCKKFYRCVDNGRGTFTKYEYMCGDGTVWDQSIEACNHAWAVKDCGYSHTETHITSTEQSTTSHAETVMSTQSSTLMTSDATDIDDIDVGYGNQGSSDTTTHASLTSTSTSTSTTENPIHESVECSSTGFMGDSKDCKKFYRCVDNGRGTFTKYEFKCGEGTLWDSDIEACNHDWAVKNCGHTSNNSDKNEITTQNTVSVSAIQTTVVHVQSTTQISTSIDDYNTGYGSPNQEPPSTSTKKPSKEPNNTFSTSECQSSGFIGDSNNCKTFYRCVDNGMGGYVRHEFTCGEGTVWDPTIEACNHAWAVKKCGGSDTTGDTSQTSEPTTTNRETTTVTNEPTHTTLHTSTMASTESFDNNKCHHSGFMGDKGNCKRFYRCVDNGDETYTRYEFTCGEGTVWDSNIEACNHEWAVKTCGGSSEYTTPIYSSSSQHSTVQDELEGNVQTTNSYLSSTTSQRPTTTLSNEISISDQECTGSGYVGDSNNCKKFYRCVDNGNGYDRYEFNCGDGTVWDDSISSCNHEWAVKKCGASGTSAPPPTSESISEGTLSPTDIDNKQPTQQTTDKNLSTTENPTENEVQDGGCVQEGFVGSLVDCKKFYRCVDDGKGGFTKYEFNCGEGTTWNPEIGTCDHPSSDRQCGQYYQSTTKGSHVHDEMGTESTTRLTPSTISSDKDDKTDKPQTTTGTCSSEGFFGDAMDCKKFYRCVDDGKGGYTKYDFNCGAGTVWNQEILACDHESDDKSCLSSGNQHPDSSPSDLEGTTSGSPLQSTVSSSTTAANNQETDKTESPESLSSEKCTSEGFFAHPHDCKKFVRCVSNGNGGFTKYEFSCGEGTQWVQEIQACDHDDGETGCSKPNISTTKSPEHIPQNSSTTESGSNAENHTHTIDDDEYPTTKEPSSLGSDKCTAEGYFGNQNDCRKFYRCVDNGNDEYTKYDFVCGDGTAWDTNTGTCNHINDVASCTEKQNEESNTQTTNSENTSQTTERPSSTTKETTSSESESSEESELEPESQDRCKSEGYHGDSKDCKKFYRCVDDGKGGLIKYDFTCADGTIWDKDITNCNHPQDVTNPSCKSGGSNDQSAESSSLSSSTTNNSESSTQSSSNCSDDSSKKPASSKDISCEDAGYYPNPNDCKKFYRCVDWDGDGKRFSVYHFECGEGTIWDPALDTCNHEESVYPPRDCSQTQSQTESSSSENTTSKQEETTTQESTTSEQTTTKESSSSEQTTTEKDKSTTQQSTTSELTTTQQSTSEQTTTQKSTTTEKTTTQESTTSEQTTTQKSTTSQKTTQESTTNEQTTQESTTSEQTTQESTTEQTTQESTTSEQTTQESTTTEQATEQSTTQENTQTSSTYSTTESSTTEDNSSTTEQSSTTESEQESSTASSSSEKECPETDDDQYVFVCPTSFKRHPKYCNMFYQCTEDDDTHDAKIATFKCPNDTIYDESKTQCVEEKKADKKCDGELARQYGFKQLHRYSMEPITVDEEKKTCSSVGYFAFEKNIECSNGFLRCEKSKSGYLRGYVNQCPEGYLFWTVSKRCELAVNIRDCKRSSNDWKGRWNIPVDRKNVA